jgi:predicted transposase/invertase (TIGR01784 family)
LPDNSRYHSTFHISEDKTHHILNDDLEIHFLELPKLLCRTTSPQNRLEKWLLYLNNVEGDEMEAIAMSEPMIRKALTCEEIFAKSAQDRRRYELREKAIAEELTLIHGAKAEGEAKGVKNAISMYLKMKFGAQATELISMLDESTNSDSLDRIIGEIFSASTPDEVKELLRK